MTALQDITAALEKRRTELGMSRAILARRSGLGIDTVQRALRGKGAVNLRTLVKLADALGLGIRISGYKQARTMRGEQAANKARQLTRMALANSALENRFVDDAGAKRIQRSVQQSLLRGSPLALWA